MELTEHQRMFSGRALKRLIGPLVVEQALAVTVGLLDTVMVSGLGEVSVSAVSLVDMINVLIINVFAALATGGAVAASQFIGARQMREARNSAKQLIFVVLIISTGLMAISLLFNGGIVRLCFGHLDENLMQACKTYYWITALSFPFIGVYNCCAALFRAMGNSKYAMYSSLFCNLLNLVGNAILIYVAKMGVAGAALSTTFARFCAMIFMLLLLTNREYDIYIDFREKFRIEMQIIRKILYVGIPSSVENSFFQLGRLIVAGIIASFGTVQIAANAVANTISGFGCIPGNAMGLAMITVIGQCVGANDRDQVRFYSKKLMKITYLFFGAWNILIIVTMPAILSIYGLSDETMHLARTLAMIHCSLGILFWPLSFPLPNILRAANDVKFTMIVSCISMCLIRITLSYVLAKGFGLGAIGVWLSMVCDWAVRSAFFVVRFKREKWLRNAIPDISGSMAVLRAEE